MINLGSLRSRVTTWYVGLLATALLAFGAVLYFAVEGYLTTGLENSLSGEASAIATSLLAFEEEKGAAWMTGEIIEAYAPEQSSRFIRITRKDGTVLYKSGDTRDPYIDTQRIPSAAFSGATKSFRQVVQDGTHHLLLYTLPYTSGSGTEYLIEMGASITPIEKVLYSLLTIILFITPLILVAAALGGHFLMIRPLRPLVALTEHAERIGSHKLGERLPVIPTGDEMERLSLSLNRMISRLEDALAYNRRFSADVSHELRTPLTILRGELEQVAQTSRLQNETRESVGSALEEIDRMAKIVENLLTIARLDSGTDVIDRREVDLGQLAQWTVDQMHLIAEEKRIAMHCTLSEIAIIQADPARVKQVLVNLLDNAIKYTAAGGEVNLTASISERMAVLEVSDNGIGIPPESLPNVFDRFYRSDRARSRESGGTGLGLSIVQAICNAHEGSVRIRSSEGIGTTVRVELPLSHSRSATPAEPSVTCRSMEAAGEPLYVGSPQNSKLMRHATIRTSFDEIDREDGIGTPMRR
jgi:heavy metal sensor kinase